MSEPVAAEVIEAIAIDPLAERLPEVADLLPESLLPLWQLISIYPVIGALFIAIVFYIAAATFRTLFARIMYKLAGLTDSSLDDAIVNDLRKPIFNSIFFFGLSLAVTVAGMTSGREILINLFVSVIVVSWMNAILKISTTLLDAVSQQDQFTLVEARTVPLFDLSIKLIIIMLGTYVLLLIWGINPMGWLASAGIVGIAVGFAAKDTLANLFAGFFIVADAPYKIGDYINLDSGERGKVAAIGLRSTRLVTRDDVEITIPNGVIANAKIINESSGPTHKLRIRIVVGVAYGSDVDLVEDILMRIGMGHEGVCQTPTPRVRMRNFGASSLDYNLMCWIEKPQDRGRISHELNTAIYKQFSAEGVEIPYAKQDVFIKEWPQSNKGPAAET